jgi:hypothetical protein
MNKKKLSEILKERKKKEMSFEEHKAKKEKNAKIQKNTV